MGRAFKFTGDFSELERWTKQIESAPKVMNEISRVLSEEVVDLIKEGFAREKDPYGRKWAPLQLRDGRILADTGRLKNSFHATSVTRHGFRVAPSVTYAAFHQGGTGIYGPRGAPIVPIKAKALRLGKTGQFRTSVKGAPKRRMVPDNNDLPPSWRDALNAAAGDVLQAHFDK